MPLAIMIFCLVLGAAFLLVAVASLWNQESTLSNARPVPAEIVGSAIGTRESADPERSGELVYYPIVTYQLNLPSGPIAGTQIYPGGWTDDFKTPEEAKKFADQFRPGTKLLAMADPACPSNCYLIAKRSPIWWIFLILAVGVSVAGVANYLTNGSKLNP